MAAICAVLWTVAAAFAIVTAALGGGDVWYFLAGLNTINASIWIAMAVTG